MGREGPGLYCKDTGALARAFIPEEKLFHHGPDSKVMLCHLYLASRKVLNCTVNLRSTSLDF